MHLSICFDKHLSSTRQVSLVSGTAAVRRRRRR